MEIKFVHKELKRIFMIAKSVKLDANKEVIDQLKIRTAIKHNKIRNEFREFIMNNKNFFVCYLWEPSLNKLSQGDFQ